MVQLIDSDIKTREVLDWRGVHVLHFAGSSCSQKLRIFLNAKSRMSALRRRGIKKLSVRISDFARPNLLNFCDQILGQRYIADFLGYLAAFGVGPGEELQCLEDSDWVLRLLVKEDESGTGDGP